VYLSHFFGDVRKLSVTASNFERIEQALGPATRLNFPLLIEDQSHEKSSCFGSGCLQLTATLAHLALDAGLSRRHIMCPAIFASVNSNFYIHVFRFLYPWIPIFHP
jgi:hypothetical protein